MSTLSVNKITDLTDFTFPPSTTLSLVGFNASGTINTANFNASGTVNTANLTITGTSGRITGDFSNATVASRVFFQTSTTDGATTIGVLPNGTSTTTGVIAGNNSDPTNWSFIGLNALSTSTRISSGISGTGTYLPLTVYTGGSERVRIDTSGNLGIGTSSPYCKADVTGVIRTTSVGAPASGAGLELSYGGTANTADILAYDRTASVFRNIEMRANNIIFNLGGAGEKARLTSGGGYSVGTTADPGAGAIYATGNITAYYSDKRLKENITPIENALAKVNAISGVTYNGNDLAAEYGYTDRSQQVGVLAQEVQEVLPEAVRHAPFDIATNVDGVEYSRSGETYLTVQYEKLVPLLIEAIKELTKRVEELESK